MSKNLERGAPFFRRNVPSELISIKEAADKIGVSVSTFRKLAAELQFKRYGHGRRLLRFDWDEMVSKLHLKG